MLHNLEAEIARRNLTKQEVADCIGISKRTLYDKLVGKTAFTIKEASNYRGVISRLRARLPFRTD